jgi:hypothetical protein
MPTNSVNQTQAMTRAQMEARRRRAEKQLRKGMTQADIARLFGVSPTTVSRWYRRMLTPAGMKTMKATGRPPRLPMETLRHIWLSRPVWTGPVWTGPAFAREYLRRLSARGVGYKAVAAAASVSCSVMARILSGARSQIRASTETRILAADQSCIADGARVAAGPTWRILDGLIAEGYSRTLLAKWLGSKARVPALQIPRHAVTARTASNVQRLARLIAQGKLQRP